MKIGLGSLYIVTTCIGMFMYYGTERIRTPWWLYSVLCSIWIIIGAVLYAKDNRLKEKVYLRRCISDIRYCFGTPYLIFLIFSVIGWAWALLSGTFEIRGLTRALSITMQYLLVMMSVMATAYIFKGKLLKYTFIAIVANNCIVILWTIMKFGVAEFLRVGLVPFAEMDVLNSAVHMLEVHDVTFAFGFFFIYYAYTQAKYEKNKIFKLFVCAFFIYIGYKRIQLAALLLVLLIAFFVREKTKRGIKFWMCVFTAVVLVVSYLYVWLIDSDILKTLAERYGINFMGRLRVYGQMANYYDFSPWYIGRGMMYGRKIGERLMERGLLNFTGHSDILMNYMDYGFWGFLLWESFICYFATKKLNRVYGSVPARMWMFMTAYALITYFTDNTTHYYAFQASYMVIMFHVIYSSNKSPAHSEMREAR